jgi:DNA polymerase-3 subunit gamma/tau
MLLRAYDEVRRAPDPAAAVEMALIRLAYAADLPGPEEALKALREGGDFSAPPSAPAPRGGGSAARSSAAPLMAAHPQPSAAPAQQPALRKFDDIVALIDARRDIALKLDVERYVRLISFRTGAIAFEPAPGAPSNLAQRLSARLKEWTGQPWLVAAEGGGGAETLAELRARELEVARAEALADPFVRQVMEVFPGAEVTEIRNLAPPETAAAAVEDDSDDDDEED